MPVKGAGSAQDRGYGKKKAGSKPKNKDLGNLSNTQKASKVRKAGAKAKVKVEDEPGWYPSGDTFSMPKFRTVRL